jgi:hypothetical protein
MQFSRLVAAFALGSYISLAQKVGSEPLRLAVVLTVIYFIARFYEWRKEDREPAQ